MTLFNSQMEKLASLLLEGKCFSGTLCLTENKKISIGETFLISYINTTYILFSEK